MPQLDIYNATSYIDFTNLFKLIEGAIGYNSSAGSLEGHAVEHVNG